MKENLFQIIANELPYRGEGGGNRGKVTNFRR